MKTDFIFSKGSGKTPYLEKSCAFGLSCVSFVNVCQLVCVCFFSYLEGGMEI